jgi:hypothetical protein
MDDQTTARCLFAFAFGYGTCLAAHGMVLEVIALVASLDIVVCSAQWIRRLRIEEYSINDSGFKHCRKWAG